MSLTARPTPASRMGRADKGISAPFGTSPQYLDGKAFHHGQDYYWLNADLAGSRKVFAAGAGTVTEVEWSDTMGGYITIAHDGGFSTRYNHMPRNSSTVAVGAKVTDQTYLGAMGSAGTAARGQYHLHFEVWVRGTRVDPEPYFNAFTPEARPGDDVKRVAAYLNGRNLGKTSNADEDGKPGPNLYWMIQTAGRADGLYPVPYIIDGKTGPRTELVFDHYVEVTKVMPPVVESEPVPEVPVPVEPTPEPAPEPEPTPEPVPPVEQPEPPADPPAVPEPPVVPAEPPVEQKPVEVPEKPAATIWQTILVGIGVIVAAVIAWVTSR